MDDNHLELALLTPAPRAEEVKPRGYAAAAFVQTVPLSTVCAGLKVIPLDRSNPSSLRIKQNDFRKPRTTSSSTGGGKTDLQIPTTVGKRPGRKCG